jgi:hypothetical protein
LASVHGDGVDQQPAALRPAALNLGLRPNRVHRFGGGVDDDASRHGSGDAHGRTFGTPMTDRRVAASTALCSWFARTSCSLT